MQTENRNIETVTVEETVRILRDCGMNISRETLGAGLQSGVFPFGIHTKGPKGGNVYWVFKRQLDEWIDARATAQN